MQLVDGVYKEEVEEFEDEEITKEGRGGGGSGGGVGGEWEIIACGGKAIETTPPWWVNGDNKPAWVIEEETIWWWWWWWWRLVLVASLNLYFNVSFLTAFNSDCKAWICCCKVDITPMEPYIGSLSLKFASYTKLFAASALWFSGTSYIKITVKERSLN